MARSKSPRSTSRSGRKARKKPGKTLAQVFALEEKYNRQKATAEARHRRELARLNKLRDRNLAASRRLHGPLLDRIAGHECAQGIGAALISAAGKTPQLIETAKRLSAFAGNPGRRDPLTLPWTLLPPV